ncbi:MFS transporter [Liquorilactobacillus sicerae]|uniref:MFS transporter n=1 Tax=Liquorilactobacillus sicerae TaxID=1416943 RepID=UPI002481852E|nr:MFS transporter [Liquorilactobacillus sicerae]
MKSALNSDFNKSTQDTSSNGSKVSERYWWKVVVLCFLGWILIYADRTILNPVMPQIAKTFQLNNAQLGLISSVFFLAYTLFQVPFGILADKVGRRIMITLGFILFAVMTFFSGIVTAFGTFLIIRAMAGIGEASYYGPQYALSGETIPVSKLTLGTAIINSGMAFGSSGGYLLSSYLVLQHHQHWSIPFFIISIPTLIVGLLFMTLKETHYSKAKKTELVNLNSQNINSHQIRDIFTNRNLVLAFFLCFCSIYAYYVVLTWLPQFLEEERGFQGTSVGFISSLVPWASIPGALMFAKLYDKYQHTKTLIWILISFAVVSLLLVGFTHSRIVLIISLIVYGLSGKLAIDPILVSFVTKQAGQVRLSTTLSTYNFIGMSGSVLAPYITGWLSDQFGNMTVGFYLGAILLLVGGIAFLATNDVKQKAVH